MVVKHFEAALSAAVRKDAASKIKLAYYNLAWRIQDLYWKFASIF
jgi:hypothetical protein